VNPKRLQLSSFELTNPQGFGLMQRDRSFSSYEDLEARYELRPSAWVKPTKPFGPGRVELVLIPSAFETNDNVVAFWVPRDPLEPGHPFDSEYDVLWQKNTESKPSTAWVVQSRRGAGFQQKASETVDFHVDFEGPMLKRLTDKSKVDAVFNADSNGEIVEQTFERHAVTGGARVSLKVKRLDPSKPVELRGFLRGEQQSHSETWAYILPPD
jgi:glucans biosynthesis protein